MSISRLTQAVVLGALLAAANLAGMTAVAHAQSEPTLTHDHQRPPTQGQVGEAWHQRPATPNQQTFAGDVRRAPTEGQVGEPWHPRQSVPMRPDEPTNQPGGLVAALAVLAAALALSGGLAARRASRRPRPQLTT
jgi:hypothetical protein